MMITPCSVRSPYLVSSAVRPHRAEVTVAVPADSALLLSGSAEGAVGSTPPASTRSWKAAGLVAFMAVPLMAGALTSGVLMAGSAQAGQGPVALSQCVMVQGAPAKYFPSYSGQIKVALEHLWQNGVEIEGANPAKPGSLAAAAVDLAYGSTRIVDFDHIGDIDHKALVSDRDVLRMADVLDGCRTYLSDMDEEALRAINVIRDNGGSFALGTSTQPYIKFPKTPAGTARLFLELARRQVRVYAKDGAEKADIRSIDQLVEIADAMGEQHGADPVISRPKGP